MDQELQTKCVEMVQYFHMNTKQWADKFQSELGRVYYVTPTSYVEMINQFSGLLAKKRKEIKDLYEKYTNGYQQIVEAEENVGVFQEQLTEMVPKLEEETKKTEIMTIEVGKTKDEADKIKEIVQKDKDIVFEKQSKSKVIQDECEKDLAEALPALHKAEEALRKLDKSHIDFLKKMVMAGTSIKKTFEGLCYILKPAPIKEKNQETLREEINWWSTGRKLIQDMGLLNKMFDYNNDKDMDDKVYNQTSY